jgi:GT2 family glycosyltransferase
MPKISLVLPTYNRLGDLRECIESVIRNTDLTDMEIIVVSNGCRDGTCEYVQSLGSPFHLLHWPQPLGYTKATNLGITVASGEYVLLFNNDNVILDWGNRTWIEQLLKPFSAPNAGVAGVAKQWRGGKPWVLFFCAMIRRNLFSRIGLLDETFSPGAGEDTDFCLKALAKGFTIHQVPVEHNSAEYQTEFPIYHKGSLTMQEIDNHDAVYRRNEAVLQARYGLGSTVKP